MVSARAPWRLVLGLIVLCAGAVISPAAQARQPPPSAAELGLEVVAGYAGQTSQADWTPVEVRLRPQRPVSATLSVEAQFFRGESGQVHEVRRVEAGAGSAKAYRFLVPTGPLRVVVTEAGREPLVERVRSVSGRGYLAGVLGTVPDAAPPLRVDALGVQGTWAAVDAAFLELSPYALAPLGGLVADLDGLTALSETARRHLAIAVASGTDLVVVADRPGPIDLGALGLPATPASAVSATAPPASAAAPLRVETGPGPAWVRTEAGVPVAAAAPAGRGRVTVVAARPGAEGLGRSAALWSSLLGPAPRVNASSGDWAVEHVPWGFGRLFSEGDAAPPVLPWLAGFIVAYVLVVGPVNVLVLSRFRRRELAWATVPLVTAIFTVSAIAGASGASPPLSVAAALSWWADGAGAQLLAVGVRGPSEGSHEVRLPGTDWTVASMVFTGQTAEHRVRADHQSIRMDLTALQLGGVIATRTARIPPPLELDAVARPEGVEVTVRNTSPHRIEEVLVRAATARTRVGALAPGTARTVMVGRARISPRDPFVQAFDTIEPSADGYVSAPASLEALLRTHLIDGSPGMVWALGRLRDEPPAAVTADGRALRDLGHLAAVGVTPRLPENGAVSPLAVDRGLLIDAETDAYRPGPLAVVGAREAFLRFRFPPGADLTAVYPDLQRGAGATFVQLGGVPPAGVAGPVFQLTVWDREQRQWLPVEQALPPTGRAAPGPLIDELGTLYVRASGDLSPFDFSARSLSTAPLPIPEGSA